MSSKKHLYGTRFLTGVFLFVEKQKSKEGELILVEKGRKFHLPFSENISTMITFLSLNEEKQPIETTRTGEHMFYPLEVAGVKRNLPLFPIDENLAIAAFILLGDQELTVVCAKALLEKAPAYDYILTAEAKGIPLVHEMARQVDAERYFVARKKMKLYMGEALSVDVQSITTAGMQKLFLTEEDARLMRGKRILIVDDVISTGESLLALERLVEKAGGVVVGRMAVLAEGKAAKRDDIIFLQPLPLFDTQGNALQD